MCLLLYALGILSGTDPCLIFSYSISLQLFFFQAEDGIRYDLVTGVQTCALPIWLFVAGGQLFHVGLDLVGRGVQLFGAHRSEERRVGKECRSRWSPYH